MSTNLLTPGNFDEDRRENREQQEQEQLRLPIERDFYLVEQAGAATHKAHSEWQQTLAAVKELCQDNKSLAFAKTQEQVPHYQFLLVLFAAYVISLLLIFESTEYLVSLVIRDNGLIRMAGILVLPLALIVIQIAVGIDVYLAEQNSSPGVTAKRRTAKVVVWITPSLIMATFIARMGGGLWFLEIIFLIVRMAVAYVTDAWIVNHGQEAYQAQTFFLFSYRHWQLSRREEQLKQQTETCAAETVQHFQECQQKLAAFRYKYPNSTLTLPMFSNPTRWALEHWMGSDYELH